MNYVTTTAMVLRRVNYGEADRIVTFLTVTHSKVAVLAKGVRKSTSKLAGGIELLGESEITFIPGKGKLSTLTSAKLLTHTNSLTKDLNRLQVVYELLKRVDKIAEYVDDPRLYSVLKQTIVALDAGTTIPVAMLWFDMQLLKLLGQAPNLRNDTTGKPLQGEKLYHFEVDRMGFTEHPEGVYNADHIKLLRLAFSLDDVHKLAAVGGVEKVSESMQALASSMSRMHIPTS